MKDIYIGSIETGLFNLKDIYKGLKKEFPLISFGLVLDGYSITLNMNPKRSYQPSDTELYYMTFEYLSWIDEYLIVNFNVRLHNFHTNPHNSYITFTIITLNEEKEND